MFKKCPGFISQSLQIGRSRIAALFVLFFLSVPGAADPLLKIEKIDTGAYPSLRIEVSLQNPYQNRSFEAEKQQFEIFEIFRGVKRALEIKEIHPVKKENKGVYIVLIIDSTLSISPKQFEESIDAVRDLIGALYPEDKIAIYSLNARAKLRIGFSRDREKLNSTLMSIKRTGKMSKIYDSLQEAIHTARSIADQSENINTSKGFNFEKNRVSVVLFTDGRDEGSFITGTDCAHLSALSRKLKIPIHTVLYGKMANKKTFGRLARLSNGELITRFRSSGHQKIANKIHRLKVHRYTISVNSSFGLHDQIQPGAKIKIDLVRKTDLTHDSDQALYVISLPNFLWLALQNIFFQTVLFLILIITIALITVFLLLKRYGEKRSGKSMPAKKHSGAEDIKDMSLAESLSGTAPYHAELERDGRRMNMKAYSSRLLSEALGTAECYRTATLRLRDKNCQETIREYDLIMDATYIGSGSSANIRLEDPALSPIHAKIKEVDGKYIIYDLVSGSGIYINRKKLLRPKALFNGDEISLGHSRFMFHGIPG